VPAGTAAPAPVSSRPEWGLGGHTQPYRVQGNVPGASIGRGVGWGGGSTAAALWRGGGAAAYAGKGRRPLNSRGGSLPSRRIKDGV
jgi:hypothetical protein